MWHKGPLFFVSFALLMFSAACAIASWERPQVQDLGDTITDKMQSITQIVTENSQDQVDVRYIANKDKEGRPQPLFLVFPAQKTHCGDMLTQQQVSQVQQARNSATVAVLRLVTPEVLPLDPSIKIVMFQWIDACGGGQLVQALTDSLKGVPEGAPDQAWIERLTRVQ